MIQLFHDVCHQCSVYTTQKYSTSFSSAIRLLHKDLRQPIYDVYGFVRFADEIVDTFHEYDKEELFQKFVADTWEAIEKGISLNPILHSFQATVNKYNVPHELIHAFLKSMETDLQKSEYNTERELDEYIYGSAEVVGLMCLCIFCEGDMKQYEQLKQPAQRLGAALQKVNFLRDLHADYTQLNRVYFPGLKINQLDDETKAKIEASINEDLNAVREGIRELPWKARYGVYTAYRYYRALYKKICRMEAKKVLSSRVSVPNLQKACIVFAAGWYNKLNWI